MAGEVKRNVNRGGTRGERRVMRGGESVERLSFRAPCKNAANACTRPALSYKVSINRGDAYRVV